MHAAFLIVFFCSVAAQAEPTLLFLEPQGAPDGASRTRLTFSSELGLALDTHQVVRKKVPGTFSDAPNDERLATAREALAASGAEAAVWLDVFDGGALESTVAILRGEHMLSRKLQTTDERGALQQLALGTRELLAGSYAWEVPTQRASEPEPRDEPTITPVRAPPPPPPTPRRPNAVGLALDVGVGGSASTHRRAGLLPVIGLGLAWSRSNHLEARLLAEGGWSSSDGVDRVRLGARADLGYRLGDAIWSFVPMATGRLGWLRTTYAGTDLDDTLAQLGIAPEVRARAGAFEVTLRPEFAWNINPLRVKRVSDASTVSRDPSLVWGAHLVFTRYF